MRFPGDPGDAGRPGPKAVKMEMTCRTCQATLPISPRSRIIVCDYCGAKNAVPDEIWNVISPPPPQAPLPPGPALPPPAVPVKKSPVAIFIIVGVFVAIFVLPMFFVFCGACIPLIGAIFSSAQSKGGSNVTITTGTPDSILNVQSPLQIVPKITNTTAVKPSFANADASEAISGVYALVKSNWSQDALLGRVIMTKVRTDGTLDLAGAGEGNIIMEFILPQKAKELQPGETMMKGGKLQVILANNSIIEMEEDLHLSELSSHQGIAAMPGCSVAQLWQRAVKEGYPAGGFASVEFPVEPHNLTSKEKKQAEKYLSYRFIVPEVPPVDKPMYFTLEDCTTR